MRLAVDTGGTFTDCVVWNGRRVRVIKLLSTPRDPGAALLAAVREAGGRTGSVRHGTTVATNTLLERNGARVAWVTTAGFEDAIAIGRQARPKIFDWAAGRAPALAGRRMRFGVRERMLPSGQAQRPPRAAELRRLRRAVAAAKPEAIAISLLFSFANPGHERAVGRALAGLGAPLSLSHRILPEFREFERGAAVLINAYVAPRMSGYLRRLGRALRGREFAVMQSSGGVIGAGEAAREPVRTILSGPAGGVVGAHAVARRAGWERILSFDMGGTSTDVALAQADGPRLSTEATVQDLPLAIPALDIHTIGAGGGSIAWFDAGGVLRVGPESAGADPGPACFGRGERPTVTDAHLVLGRLDDGSFLDGGLRLDRERARRVLERHRGPLRDGETFAAGIVAVVEAAMDKALRLISIERGHDPRAFTLVAFGGAGPLHAASLARGLGLARVLVPAMPGALSALGILAADAVRDYSRTVMLAAGSAGEEAALEQHFRQLEKQAGAGRKSRLAPVPRGSAPSPLPPGGALRSLDMRYQGQGYELNVPAGHGAVAAFHAEHARRFGYADPERRVEVVNIRLRVSEPGPGLPAPPRLPRRTTKKATAARFTTSIFDGKRRRTPVYRRDELRPGDRLRGPALIAEYSATTVLPPGASATVDQHQNLVIAP